jgi:hypothetical protein
MKAAAEKGKLRGVGATGRGKLPTQLPRSNKTLNTACRGSEMKKSTSKEPSVLVIDPASLVKSKAWLSLTGISTQVYMLFLLRRQGKKPSKKAKWQCTNGRSLIFTYREAEKDFGITPRRFLCAVDQLVEFGFIDIVQPGVPATRVPTTYGLSLRWMKFGTEDFEIRERAKGMHVGFCRR